MRIAYVCADPGVPVFGQKGCSIHVQEVIRALQQQNAQVELFASRIGGKPPSDLANLPVHLLPAIPKLEPAVREQVALSINPDLHLDLERAGSFDFIYERYSLWSYSAMEYAQSAGIPGLLEVNAPLIEEQAQHRELVDRASAERVADRVFTAATTIIAVSAAVKTYLANRQVNHHKVQVIPNGVDPSRFSLVHPVFSGNCESFTIGFVGTLKPWHGLSILVEAFAQLHQRVPQAKLLIVGDGSERERLKADLTARGLRASTRFTGAVSPDAIPGLLAAMDVAVAPYPAQTDFYFSPLKVYEYMAAGLPVIASSIGQLPDLIQSGRNGILCPPGDSVALADALEKLWRSPALRYRLGWAAQQTVIKHHTWAAIAKRILHIGQVAPDAAAYPAIAEVGR